MAFIYFPIYCSRSFTPLHTQPPRLVFVVLTGIVAATEEYIFGFLQYSCI